MRCKDWNIEECVGCKTSKTHPLLFGGSKEEKDSDICWVMFYIEDLSLTDELSLNRFIKHYIMNGRTHLSYLRTAISIQFPDRLEIFDKLAILL